MYFGLGLFHDISVLGWCLPGLIELEPVLNLLPQMLAVHIRRYIYATVVKHTAQTALDNILQLPT